MAEQLGESSLKNLPFWFPNKKNIVWYFLFIFLFLLSLDFWNWEINLPLIFGMPFWMLYFLVLTLFTSFAFYLFSKFVWRKDK
jgi:hypothetical protein